jgi:phosphohistidine phosphatase
MNLFILRHAKAQPRSPKWRPDSKRPLTREGESSMFEVARGIKALEVSFDVILTSPYVRALRTAEILAEVYESEKIFETARLAPEAGAKEILDEVNENFSAAGEIVLVGHEPFLSRLISTLLTGEDGMAMELKKAGFCKLTMEKLVFGKCACLEWLLTARQLARLGRRE